MESRVRPRTTFVSVAGPRSPGYSYCEGKRAPAGSSGTPTPSIYIADPQRTVMGESMSAPPLRDERERADLIAYLTLLDRAVDATG